MEESDKGPGPQFSIIIPVLNEGNSINGLLDHLLGLEWKERPEIIVVDGDPDGGSIGAITAALARALVAPRGRAAQMNTGAGEASGNILLFLHADTRLPPAAPDAIAKSLETDEITAGAFSLGVDSRRKSLRLIARLTTLRSRLTRIPYGDQAIFIKEEVFREVGGFREIPVLEDLELMRRLRKAKKRITILPLEATSSPRRWEKEGVIRCTLRNWTIKGLYLLGMSPERLARFYRHDRTGEKDGPEARLLKP